MAFETLMGLYQSISDPELRLRLLLVAAEDWSAEANVRRLRRRLLDEVSQMPAETVATVARGRNALAEEVRAAIEGLVVLDDEFQIRRLATPLAAVMVRYALEQGRDEEIFEAMINQMSDSSALSLERLATHLGRPAPGTQRARRI